MGRWGTKEEGKSREGRGVPAGLGGNFNNYKVPMRFRCSVGRAYNPQGAHTFKSLGWESRRILDIFSLIVKLVRVFFNTANNTEGVFQALAIVCLPAIHR